MAVLIADKIDLKLRKMTRDSQGHIIWIKGSIHQKEITILSACISKAGPQNTLSKKLQN